MIIRLLGFLVLFRFIILGNGILSATAVDSKFTTRPKVVNIGAILSFNSTIGKVAKIAIQTALKDVNSSPQVLQGTQLNISMLDSNENGFLGAVEDIVDYFGWREVTAIYTDDDYGRNGIADLGDKLAQKRCTLRYKARLSPISSRDDIRNVLFEVALQESRILVLHTYDVHGLEVLQVARSLHMLERGYVWIATNWLSNVIDTNSPLSPTVLNNIQGLLTLRVHTPNSQLKRNFVSRWRNLVSEENERDSFGLNTYGLYAYDTVWILARALDAYLKQGRNISFSNNSLLNQLKDENLHLDAMSTFDGGGDLLSNIFQVKMTGLTGRVEYDSDRNLINPALDIINVVGTGQNTIGFWSNFPGLSHEPPEYLPSNKSVNNSSSSQRLFPVIWLGHSTDKPRGWVFPNNGNLLRVGVPWRVDYNEFIKYSTEKDSFSGFCIEVFTSAVDLLPYAVPYKLIPFGNGKDNPSISELVEKITAGVFDAVVGDVSITTDRTRNADFTQPYIESGLVVVAPVQAQESSAWAFLRPFTPTMWCVTGLSFIVVGAVVWILEHRFNDEFRGPPGQQIATMLWFSCSTWFFAHRENTVSTLGRLVLIIWLFAVLIINSSYTASLTSMLTVQQLTSHIKGIDSLIQSREPIGYQEGSFAFNHLNEQLNVPESLLVPLTSEDEYAIALKKGPKNGGVAAVVGERAYMELFLSSRCEFTIVGQEFTKNGWGYAFPRDSSLAVDMSTALLQLFENGDLQSVKRAAKIYLSRNQLNQKLKLMVEAPGLVLLLYHAPSHESPWGLKCGCNTGPPCWGCVEMIQRS